MRMKRPAAAVLSLSAATALLVAGCSSSPAPAPASDSSPVGISTQGTGVVTGTPDTVTVVLGVQTQGDSAEAALEQNAKLATGLLETLKSNGIEDKDLQTSGLSVYPDYDPSGAISGYQVHNQVTATMRDAANSGKLIDAAAGAAGDAIRVQNLSFSISDDSELLAEARAQAVQQAQQQAQQIADAAGVKLGALRSITEDPGMAWTPYPERSFADMAASTPVEVGSQELTVGVSVVYEID